jgi:cytochrome c biogenesis protein ResB
MGEGVAGLSQSLKTRCESVWQRRQQQQAEVQCAVAQLRAWVWTGAEVVRQAGVSVQQQTASRDHHRGHQVGAVCLR